MRTSSLVCCGTLAFWAACTTPPRLVQTADDSIATIESVADDVAGADVVVLGELHGVSAVHDMHLRLIRELHRLRPDLVIAMEMFERDVQARLLRYLTGQIDEKEFLEGAHAWKRYEADYRPVVEFARANGLVVLAANAPRKLMHEVTLHGAGAVLGNPNVARETTAPEDAYWDAFADMMKGHGGDLESLSALRRYYEAQCLKDDTMAETIVDHLRSCGENPPLVVLICGRMHSDYGRGTVQRLRSRMPDLDVRVLSAELVSDVGAGLYSSRRDIADYVIVAPESEASPPPPVALEPESEAEPGSGEPEEEPVEASEPEESEERAALGLMPEYGAADEGVMVGMLRPGGPAEAAGLQEGDVIVELAGKPVEDIQAYVEVLGGLRPGQKVPVKAIRDGRARLFQVVLTVRTR